jgi:hypothetical protein
MPTAADYRRQAETCLSLALGAADPAVADKLRDMACDLTAKSLHPEQGSAEREIVEFPAYVTRRTEEPRLRMTDQ